MIKAKFKFKLRNQTWVEKNEPIEPQTWKEREWLLESGLAYEELQVPTADDNKPVVLQYLDEVGIDYKSNITKAEALELVNDVK